MKMVNEFVILLLRGGIVMQDMMWPREDANIRMCDKDSKYRVNLKCSGNISNNFSEYGDDFFKSAHVITEYILERGRIGELDCYFFALAYLYRHSLELKLKAIAFKYITESGESFIKDTFHNLVKILEYIEPFIQEEIEYDNDAYEWLKFLLEDMNPIDKDSDAFRYPFKIEVIKDEVWGDKSYKIKKFFEGQKHINLIAFANKMEIAFDMLCSYSLNEKRIYEEYKEYNTVFLEEGGEYYYQSVIGYNYRNDFYEPMIKGYSESGEYLADLIIENPNLKTTFFFPMCYLFRNALELELKQIWFEECAFEFEEKCKRLDKSKHSFEKMWNMINRDLINHSQGEGDQSVISYAKQYILQINALDSSSSVFRYPVDKHLRFHFKNSKFLDAKNVGEFFKEISEFLQCVDMMMNDHNQYLADMEAEYASYF